MIGIELYRKSNINYNNVYIFTHIKSRKEYQYVSHANKNKNIMWNGYKF